MSRSLYSIWLKRAFIRSQQDVDVGRRKFLRNSALTAVALAMPLGGCWNNKPNSIGIVGGGIAGLTAAYQLKKNGIECPIYEATGRPGGRVLTVDNAVVEGCHVDFGGEFIDATHTHILDLAKELGVEINDLRKDPLIAKTFYFSGRLRTEEELVNELKPFAAALTRDVNSLPEEMNYQEASRFQMLDEKSILQYLEELGMKGWLLDFFDMAMTSEYAMEASEQSAINLLIMLSTPVDYREHYHLLGDHHEVMKFKGGSQRFVDKLSANVQNQLHLGYRLKSLKRQEDKVELTFATGSSEERIPLDYVILTIPFPVLRGLETNFKFPERKQSAIDNLGFGNASKVAMGFNKRVWREQGYQGYTFTDINRTVIWDSAQMIDTEGASLSFVGGGKISDDFLNKSYREIKEQWLGGAERIYPGLTAHYNGNISKFCWATYPFAKGSYSCYKRGQWSAYAGVEGEPFENILFAGEHCSVKSQGFMNGAAESGTRAAREIVQRISNA